MSNVKYKRFSQLLYTKFCFEKKHDAGLIAARMNVPLSTFYNWIEGISNFPPDLIPNLYNATADIDFIDFLLSSTNLFPVRKQNTNENKSLNEEALDIAAQVGISIHTFNTAWKDKKLSDSELSAVKKEFRKSQREIEELLQALESDCV